jgi:hypothetical protein
MVCMATMQRSRINGAKISAILEVYHKLHDLEPGGVVALTLNLVQTFFQVATQVMFGITKWGGIAATPVP